MGDRFVLQQGAVAGQDDASVALCDVGDLLVVVIVAVEAVETQQAQVARQPSEIGVDDEARYAQRCFAEPYQWADVQALEHGIDADAVAGLDDVGKIHGAVVGQDQFDFGVRYAEGFDQILDRGASREFVCNGRLAQRRRQEIVQFFIEAQLHLWHRPVH